MNMASILCKKNA